MSDMSLLPVGSGMGSDALAAAGGAFVGGLFGNWFGNGFGGNGWGGRGGYPAEAAVVAQGAADTVILDNLNSLQSSINGLGLSIVQGQGLLYGCKWVSYWIGEQLEYFKVSVKIDKYRRYEIMLL